MTLNSSWLNSFRNNLKHRNQEFEAIHTASFVPKVPFKMHI